MTAWWAGGLVGNSALRVELPHRVHRHYDGGVFASLREGGGAIFD